MNYKSLFIHKSLYTCLIALVACGGPVRDEADTESGSRASGKTEGGKCVTEPQATVADRFDTLNILVETSGSMAGFMPTEGSQTAFQRQLDDLLANAEADNAATLQLFSAGREIQPLTPQKFRKMLRQGLKETTASTALPNLIRQVASRYTGSGQVSLFISDFIYAPPNAADRDYISNDIRRALAAAERQGLAVSVYAFQSEFKGTFYPAGAKNGSSGQPLRNCCETELPYYIWAIGPEESLRRVSQHILAKETDYRIDFGFERRKPAYQLMPGAGRGGSWYTQNPQGTTITVDNTREISSGEMKFTLGINLENQAGQWATTQYLQENLELDVQNGEAEVEEVYTQIDFEKDSRLTSRDQDLVRCFSHFVIVKMNSIGNRNQAISLSLNLPAAMPNWTEEWTTEDDRRPDESGVKTFALKDMLIGINNLYAQEKQEVFSLPLTIHKAK
jgi:hypothetical protein